MRRMAILAKSAIMLCVSEPEVELAGSNKVSQRILHALEATPKRVGNLPGIRLCILPHALDTQLDAMCELIQTARVSFAPPLSCRTASSA